jgi:hypothetical protein
MNRGGWEVIEERQSKNKVVKPYQKPVDNGLELHWKNFIDAIRNNKPESLHCPIQDAAHVANVAQMGNIAYRSGKKLVWDAGKQSFSDKKVQKKYYTKLYHNGYKLPKL